MQFHHGLQRFGKFRLLCRSAHFALAPSECLVYDRHWLYYSQKGVSSTEIFVITHIMPEPSDKTSIHQRIRQLRTECAGGRGKADFARRLGISPSTYDYYEKSRTPPAELLVRIAELAGADLLWLLTGRAGPSTPAADHPSIGRAAHLLAHRPDAAGPLGAFVTLLAEVARTFPHAEAGQGSEDRPSPAAEADRPSPAPEIDGPAPAPDRPAPAVAQAPPSGADDSRAGWIPILGRTAAGVPQFWPAGEGEGVVSLADLVGPIAGPSRTVGRARAVPLAGGEAVTVEMVRLDRPAPPGASEFVVIDPAAARAWGSPFAVRVDGDSMAPDIRHGDVVVLCPDTPAADGAPAVVQLTGQIGVSCKLYRRDGQWVHLIPVNDRYAPTRHPLAELTWALKVLARVRPD